MLKPYWTQNPVIYEINVWIWLSELSRRYQHKVTLQTVPTIEWDKIAEWKVDCIWLMGVWERSPAGRTIARNHEGLNAEYRRTLPDFNEKDVVGSPYSVHAYTVDQHLGGDAGLSAARHSLSERNIRLVLDFVPNHVATDHPWVTSHSEYFIHGESREHLDFADDFFEVNGELIAHGRDPYFPPWTDTAQLNAFNPSFRQAAKDTLCNIATRCDGVRCDMAMLMINDIFKNTWGARAGNLLPKEFWVEIIEEVKSRYANFIFIAEAYWDKEWELQNQGFNYCYDKRLYDRLLHENAQTIKFHLKADISYQNKLIRFIENHDEPRAASLCSFEKLKAVSVVQSTLPGAKLYHEGQFEGKKVKTPVQLGRCVEEIPEEWLSTFYLNLIKTITQPVFRSGEWMLCSFTGWIDNDSYQNMLSWCWKYEQDRILVVVNFSDSPSQAMVSIPWEDLRGGNWYLFDNLKEERFERSGDEMVPHGLYVSLPPWGVHLFSLSAIT